jgi:hypothetical protein
MSTEKARFDQKSKECDGDMGKLAETMSRPIGKSLRSQPKVILDLSLEGREGLVDSVGFEHLDHRS